MAMNDKVICLIYLEARPSWFPPSPTVMYTGADLSATGYRFPPVML
jgi:hypothetical protein